ncbi:MAG: hypothetical protein JJD97_02945 [Gemmatimonadaceae bacterium]|nr:hypothetical protein [Gemmatimonadaceae bacterium]
MAPAAAASDSVTGCLQKGDKAGSFKLVAKDGKSYDVWSKKVSLAGHVGHTVTLTGNMGGAMSGMRDSAKASGMGDSSKMGKMDMTSPSMEVSGMSMVSATCS